MRRTIVALFLALAVLGGAFAVQSAAPHAGLAAVAARIAPLRLAGASAPPEPYPRPYLDSFGGYPQVNAYVELNGGTQDIQLIISYYSPYYGYYRVASNSGMMHFGSRYGQVFWYANFGYHTTAQLETYSCPGNGWCYPHYYWANV